MIFSCQKKIEKNELNIAVANDFPRFSFKLNNTYTGLENDLILLISEKLKVTVTPSFYEFQDLLQTFYTEEFDIAIGGISKTDGRSEYFDFSIPYYTATQTVLARLNAEIQVDSLKAISTKKIGVCKNTASLFFYENVLMRKYEFSAANLHRFDTQKALVRALQDNAVDFVIVEETEALLLSDIFDLKVVYRHQDVESYHLIYKKGNKLQKQIDKTLIDILQSDDWKQSLKKWLVES